MGAGGLINCSSDLEPQMLDKKDITKLEFGVVQKVCAGASFQSEWWSLQLQLLRESIIYRSTEANFKSLGVTPAVRMQRDSGRQRLDAYIKVVRALLADVKKSKQLAAQVQDPSMQEKMMSHSVAEFVEENYLKDLHCLASGVTACIQDCELEFKTAVDQLSSHTFDFELPEGSWKKTADKNSEDRLAVSFS